MQHQTVLKQMKASSALMKAIHHNLFFQEPMNLFSVELLFITEVFAMNPITRQNFIVNPRALIYE